MGIESQYRRRDFNKGPSTYSDTALLDKIFEAAIFLNPNDIVVDLMSGPAKVGLGMVERELGERYIALDLEPSLLKRIQESSTIEGITGDVRELPLRSEAIGVAIVRYGLKDIPKDQQLAALREINRTIFPGGGLVIVDMVSPEGVKDWLNEQHSLKQQRSGRNIKAEGECHIPTEAEWLSLLTLAGFQADVYDHYVSRVSTPDWVKGNQISEENRGELDRFILNAPEEAIKAFNVRQENGEVKIDYPVVIIKASKSVYATR